MMGRWECCKAPGAGVQGSQAVSVRRHVRACLENGWQLAVNLGKFYSMQREAREDIPAGQYGSESSVNKKG